MLGKLGGGWGRDCLVDLAAAVEPGLEGLGLGNELRAILELFDHFEGWWDELAVILGVVV